MTEPYRTAEPPDDSAELAEIEEWLMQLPASPGYRASPPVTGWRLVVRKLLAVAVLGPYVLGLVVLAFDFPLLWPGLAVGGLGAAVLHRKASRAAVRRNMRRAGLLP